MIGLGTLAHLHILHFNEIADPHIIPDLCTGTKARIWPDLRTARHHGPLQMAESADLRTAFDRHPRSEHDIGLDLDIICDLGVMAEKHGFRRDHANTCFEQFIAATFLEHGFGFCQLHA